MKEQYIEPDILNCTHILTRDFVCASYTEQVQLDASSLEEDHLNW